MRKNRTSLLAPFFSSMAILSFKKKSKEDESSDIPLSSSPMSEMSLGGGGLSLDGLGGGIGSLSSLGLGNDGSDDLGGGLLSMSGGNDNKLRELEAGVSDIKKQAETSELATRAMRGDIENIKDEMAHINESIKSLLNVYEAVSQQYNPFVEDSPGMPASAMGDLTPLMSDDAERSGRRVPLSEAMNEMINGLADIDPFDDEGPLDRIVRPDDDLPDSYSADPYPFAQAAQEEMSMDGGIGNLMNTNPLNDTPRFAEAPSPKAVAYQDTFALEQTRRLVEHLMTKICRECSNGMGVCEADRRALDLWMGEFKRLGGL